MVYSRTIEQQYEYVKDLRAMWLKVARVHGVHCPQEEAIYKVLCDEGARLDEMRGESNE